MSEYFLHTWLVKNARYQITRCKLETFITWRSVCVTQDSFSGKWWHRYPESVDLQGTLGVKTAPEDLLDVPKGGG